MKTPNEIHDLNNALIYLSVFPDILLDHLPSGHLDDNEGLREALDIYREKIAALKKILKES